MSTEHLVRVFDSREAVNVYQTYVREQSQMALSDWQRVFKEPVTQLNDALEGALTGLDVNLDSCWEEIPGIEGGKVRRIWINWMAEGATQEIRVTESRINNETARLNISIQYPDRSGPTPTYDWEVHTLSLKFNADEIVIAPDEKGEQEKVVIEVSQLPVLFLQVSETPCKRLDLDPCFGDYDFWKPWEAKKIFVKGVERVCQVLKNPNVEIIPQ